jgi:hypothetical protein
MSDEYSPGSEGELRVLENELAHAFENRVYIYEVSGRLIGKALHLKLEPSSSYRWLLVDVCCSEVPSEVIRIVVERWRLDAMIFHEGYGWMTTTTQERKESVEIDGTFHLTRLTAVPMPQEYVSLHLYRYITLEKRT